MKKGYKVVSRDNHVIDPDELEYDRRTKWEFRYSGYSATMLGKVHFYSTTKITHAEHGQGPLCVFSDLESARRFIQELFKTSSPINLDDYAIFECEFEPSLFTKIWRRDSEDSTGKHDKNRDEFPINTELASWVRLLVKVE